MGYECYGRELPCCSIISFQHFQTHLLSEMKHCFRTDTQYSIVKSFVAMNWQSFVKTWFSCMLFADNVTSWQRDLHYKQAKAPWHYYYFRNITKHRRVINVSSVMNLGTLKCFYVFVNGVESISQLFDPKKACAALYAAHPHVKYCVVGRKQAVTAIWFCLNVIDHWQWLKTNATMELAVVWFVQEILSVLNQNVYKAGSFCPKLSKSCQMMTIWVQHHSTSPVSRSASFSSTLPLVVQLGFIIFIWFLTLTSN